MDSSETLRQRMVKGQLIPEGIESPELLKAFASIPREYFLLSEKNKGIAYQEGHLKLEGSRYLTGPSVLASLIQLANPQPRDLVLYIGAMTGYGAFIMAFLANRVFALEEHILFYTHMEQNQKRLKTPEIFPHQAALVEGYPEKGPYDLIFIEGAVQKIPEVFLAQLKPEGRIVGAWQLFKEEKRAFILKKSLEGSFLLPQYLFRTSIPLLEAFFEKTKFNF